MAARAFGRPSLGFTYCVRRLIEVINGPPGQLYLVFEFIEKDLKKYMDKVEGPLDMMLVKVGSPALSASWRCTSSTQTRQSM